MSVVAEGLGIPLLRDPPLSAEPIFFPPPGDPEKARAIQEEVGTMLLKGAVEEVPRSACTPGFYSRMFLVRKKSGAWRPIIDLSAFNKHVDSPHFKMETPRGIIASVREGMWATSVDLKDAYFHVPIKKSARKYLRFTCGGKVFQFRAMPFGLTTAPLVFTKLLQVVVGFLHSRSIDVHIYFDDSLMLHLVRESLVQDTRLVLKLLLKVGFIPSREKSEVSPSQDFVFLGNRFATVQGIVLPPLEKFVKARELALYFIGRPQVQVRWFLRFLGYLNSLADVVPLGRLHIRPLQMFLLSNWVPSSREWEAMLPVNQSVREFARWWTIQDNVLRGVPLTKPAPTMTLYTDASMTGWGAYLDGHARSGEWSGLQLSEHINVLEMRAVLLALQSLRKLLQAKVICVATDNSTVVAYLEKQGGTRSHVLCALAIRVLLLCQEMQLTIQVKHLPGRLNVLADTLSRRRQPVLTEWQLNPSIFEGICQVWDRPHIDLFATALNYQLPTYVSPVPDPQAWAVDALSLDWNGMSAYAFPPFNLVGRILQKFREHSCSLLLVAPLWPRQSWFPELLSLLVADPLALPVRRNLLRQPRSRTMHSCPEILHLHAWRLSQEASLRRAFLRTCQIASHDRLGLPRLPSTNPDGRYSVIGASSGRLIRSRHLSR